MEELVLTDPVVTPEQISNKYRVVSLVLNHEASSPGGVPGLVMIQLRDNLGLPFAHQYTGQAALDMIKWLNTANFTTKSMHKRILEKLSNDGVLPGSVTGTPDPPAQDDL